MKKSIVVGLAAACAAICAPRAFLTAQGTHKYVPSADEAARWAQEARDVTIIRDDWGIAHVHGKTDADAVFGMVYAQAEDDFNRVETNFINSMGRLAEAEGEQRVYQDLRMKLFINPDSMKVRYAGSPAFLKALMIAWADGLNFYLAKNPKVTPRVITRFEPWMALTFSEGSIGGDIEGNVTPAQLQAFYGNGAAAPTQGGYPPARFAPGPTAPTVDDPDFLMDPGGSNGMAVAPSNTVGHHALLLINPHTSFYFRSELQVTSDEGLDVYGAATWGQFFIYQGFNKTAGWMHTSSERERREQVSRDDREEGRSLLLQVRQRRAPCDHHDHHRSLQDRQGNGGEEVHGLLLTAWSGRGRGQQWEVDHRGHHAGAGEGAHAVVHAHQGQGLRGVPPDHGAPHQLLQQHDLCGRRGEHRVLPRQLHPEARPAVQPGGNPVDGSNPATDWHGLLSVDETPHPVRTPASGWLYNSNNWPWSAAGPSSPKQSDFPPYLDKGTESARGLHAIRVLSNKKDFTLDGLMAAAYDSYQTWFEKPIPALIKAWDQTPASNPLKAKVADQIAVLRPWDLRWSATSVPTTLAIYWAEDIQRSGRGGARGGGGATSAADPLGDRYTSDQMLQSLANASAKLTTDFGTWKTPWGDVNRFQRLNDDINATFTDSGASIPVEFTTATWGSLASFATRSTGTKKRYGISGNSFVAVIEFGDSVRAKAVTAGGEGGNPASPHFNDEAKRYPQRPAAGCVFLPVSTQRAYGARISSRRQMNEDPGTVVKTGSIKPAVLILIPLMVALNLVLGAIVATLKLPIFLDSVGIILTGILAGPWAAARSSAWRR